MIARIGFAAVNASALTIESELFRRDRLSRLRIAAGCLDAFLLVNHARDAILIITLWESDQTWSAFEASAAPLPFGLVSDAFERYEIMLSAGSSSGPVALVHQANALPEHISNIVTLFENIVMHASTSQQGFQGILLVIDAARGHGLSISFWSSKDDLIVSERSGYVDDQVARVATYLIGSPTSESFDLLRAE